MKRGVSVYSYREGDFNEYLPFEAQLAAIKEIGGVEGIEILPQLTSFCRYPNPSVADIDRWFELMDKYGQKPLCMDSEVGATLMRGRNASFEEQVLIVENELKIAHDFGFHILRTPTYYGIEQSVIEACIPLAEKLDVAMSFEIHCPFTVNARDVQNYLGIIERTGTKHMGFVPDLAIYCKNIPHRLVDYVLRKGANPELVQYVVEAFKNREDMAKVSKEVMAKDSSKLMNMLLEGAREYNKNGNPEDLRDIAKYITHVHAKFYDVDESYQDNDINNEGVIKVLKDCGFEGCLVSEYEGQVYYYPEDGEMYDEVEQVRRHQELLKRLIGEI